MNIQPFNGLATYAENIREFESNCILDKRTFYIAPKEHRLALIIQDLIQINKRTMKTILEHNGLLFYPKQEALTLSGNFWGDIYSTLKNTYRKTYNEEMDASLTKKFLQFKDQKIELPEFEELSYREYKKIVLGPGKKILNHCCSIAKISILSYDLLDKGIRKKIKELRCLHYIQTLNRMNGKTPITLTTKNDGSEVRADDAIRKLLKDNYRVVSGERQHGDTILYINPNNEIEHIGRFKNSEIVESKWGLLPVFLHEPENLPYENSYVVLR